MTEDERRALGATRRLVFQNLANGVPAARVRESLRLSDLEIEQAQAFVSRKITEYLVLRRQPPIPCQTMAEIRWNRAPLQAVLARIGDIDLSTSLIVPRILVQAMDHPEMIEGASRKMEEFHA
jgi:hypothetical protein